MQGGQECGENHWRPNSLYQDADCAGDDQARYHCSCISVHVDDSRVDVVILVGGLGKGQYPIDPSFQQDSCEIMQNL